jgi:hypothetical protein
MWVVWGYVDFGCSMSFEAEQSHWCPGTPEQIYTGIQQYAVLGISACILSAGAPFDLAGLEARAEVDFA